MDSKSPITPCGRRVFSHLFTAVCLIALACSTFLPSNVQAAPAAVPGTWVEVQSMVTARESHTATLLLSNKILVVGGRGKNGAVLVSGTRYDPNRGTWSTTASLTRERYEHTATLLPDGMVLVTGGRDGTGVLNSAELYDPVNDTWADAGFMAVARYAHTATLLMNGKVLVAGGNTGSGATNQVEVYDPVAKSWTTNTSLITSRCYHTASLINGQVLFIGGQDGSDHGTAAVELYNPTFPASTEAKETLSYTVWEHTATPLLKNGLVLVAGGRNAGGFLSNAQMYDANDDNWISVPNLAEARSGHSATALPNGKVIVAGGWNGSYLDHAEQFTADLATGNWGPAGTLVNPCAQHTAVYLISGELLLVGGKNTGGVLASAGQYLPANGSWSAAGSSMTYQRYSPTAMLLPDDRGVLVMGGTGSTGQLATAEIYRPNGTWELSGSMTIDRSGNSATLLTNGKVLVAGGQSSTSSSFLSSAELFDPETGTWSATGSMLTPRSSHTATLLPNGKVLLVGGMRSNSASNATAELYDPVLGTWSSAGQLATPRKYHTATLLPNGYVVVAGGWNADDGYLSSVEIYAAPTRTWITGAPSINYKRGFHTATLLPDGRMMVVGGYNNTVQLNSAEIFDIATNTWTPAASMNYARERATATLLQSGKVLVAGGSFNSSTRNESEIYDPVTNQWTVTGGLIVSRQEHTATLLSNGKVLAAGGVNAVAGVSSEFLASAELFDPEIGFQEIDRPVVSTITGSMPGPKTMAVSITGSQLRGRFNFEGVGGTTNSSATNYPLVQIRRLDSGQSIWLAPDSTAGFTETTFVSSAFSNFPSGPALVTVFVNGIPSLSKMTQFQWILTKEPMTYLPIVRR